MKNYHSSLIASRGARRQVEILDRAERAADNVDRVIGRAWQLILGVLRTNLGYHANLVRSLIILEDLAGSIRTSLISDFARAYKLARQAETRDIVDVLPNWILRQMSPAPAEVVESREDLEGGSIEIDRSGAKTREPARRKRSAKREKKIYQGLIFPGPTPEEVAGRLAPFVRPDNWAAIGGDSGRKMPRELAQAIAGGIARGLTQQQLAKEILPYFAGQQSRARTVARTFSMLVAQHARTDAAEQMGDMLIGYQVHATRDSHTRPEHAARDGTVYYKDPKGHQKGMDQMPQPPLEADGSLAFNCRCWLSPVLKPLDSLIKDPLKAAKFQTAAGRLVPDPVDYSAWFGQATEKERIQSIGPRRYNTVKQKLDRQPQYADFLDHESGNLLPIDDLAKETEAEWFARRTDVDKLIAARREQIKEIATFGFEVPPPTVPATPLRFGPAPAPIIVAATPKVTPPFRLEIYRAADKIPPKVQNLLSLKGIEIVVPTTLVEHRPELKKKRARGWPAGTTYEHVDAAFYPHTKEILVAEHYVHPETQALSMNIRPAAALAHETGHGFDEALNLFSARPEFLAAYYADLDDIIKHGGEVPPYFLQAGEAGPEEVFAEIFSQLLGHASLASIAGMWKSWPRTAELIRGLY